MVDLFFKFVDWTTFNGHYGDNLYKKDKIIGENGKPYNDITTKMKKLTLDEIIREVENV